MATQIYNTENCPHVCNAKNDPHTCLDCLANADGSDCRHFDSNGFCRSAACVAYSRECPFDVGPVKCEWFECK